LSTRFLATLEERLASHVGPIASLLVRRAASKATDSRALAAQLARHLPDDAARREWGSMLKQHLVDSGQGSSFQSVSRTLAAGSAHAVTTTLDPAHIEAATRQLAVHVGPIARIVAGRAARSADRATFHARLADALPPSVDKEMFLRALGESPT